LSKTSLDDFGKFFSIPIFLRIFHKPHKDNSKHEQLKMIIFTMQGIWCSYTS
jgi:hypothetical protein